MIHGIIRGGVVVVFALLMSGFVIAEEIAQDGSSTAFTESQTMYVGDVKLCLGMTREAAIKALTKYKLLQLESTKTENFAVIKGDKSKFDVIGAIGFENDTVSLISRSIDTSEWPNDEGFAIARAIYEALNSSIPTPDPDGTKRANANITIEYLDLSQPKPDVRTITIFVNKRKISILICNGSDGESVSVSVEISAKPW